MSYTEPGTARRAMTSQGRWLRASPLTLAVLAVSVVLVTACSSGGSHDPAAAQSSPPAASAAATTPPTASAAGGSAAPACTAPAITQDTAHAVTPASATTGTSYYAILISNDSSSTCSLTGYLNDIEMLTTLFDGQLVASAAVDQAVSSPATITLPPGATAYATLSVKAPGDYSASECDPVTAYAVGFGLPGQDAVFNTPVGPVQVCKSLPAGAPSEVGIAPIQPGNGTSDPEL
jgi:archaellum component FlaG (FlaF/FlaG flagellin family)